MRTVGDDAGRLDDTYLSYLMPGTYIDLLARGVIGAVVILAVDAQQSMKSPESG